VLTARRQHRNLILLRKGEIVGGTCFRPFHAQKFVEIVFLAITMSEQTRVRRRRFVRSEAVLTGAGRGTART
jgi:hypothetical protein